MRQSTGLWIAVLAPALGFCAVAAEAPIVTPRLLHQQVVEGMPSGEQQELRVILGLLEPGDTTGYHTHRFPLTVYVVEGEFTLEIDGGEPLALKAGDVAVEPPNVRVVGYNAGTTRTRIIDFYVSDPGTPFVDAAR